jgi:hypothetical protein
MSSNNMATACASIVGHHAGKMWSYVHVDQHSVPPQNGRGEGDDSSDAAIRTDTAITHNQAMKLCKTVTSRLFWKRPDDSRQVRREGEKIVVVLFAKSLKV